jgi:predicted DNA-binding transcriptional regulator YafY
VPKKTAALVPTIGQIFAAIDAKRKVRVRYADASAQETQRTIWPLGAFF